MALSQRVSELIEGYECELRKVQPARYDEYLGYAIRFYGGSAFEALQIVWPDKQHRFPWQEGYAAPAEQQPKVW